MPLVGRALKVRLGREEYPRVGRFHELEVVWRRVYLSPDRHFRGPSDRVVGRFGRRVPLGGPKDDKVWAREGRPVLTRGIVYIYLGLPHTYLVEKSTLVYPNKNDRDRRP